MVLEAGDQDLVAGADVPAPPGAGHQVDRFGGATHEDDLTGARGVEETPHGLARPLVGLGRELRQSVDSALDIGVPALVAGDDRRRHGPRLLGGGGVVEVDQRAAVDLAREDRKLGPHPREVVDREGRVPRC